MLKNITNKYTNRDRKHFGLNKKKKKKSIFKIFVCMLFCSVLLFNMQKLEREPLQQILSKTIYN